MLHNSTGPKTVSPVRKNLQRLGLAVLAAVLVVGCVSTRSKNSLGSAHVVGVDGDVAYSINGPFFPLRVNMLPHSGTTIKTGRDSFIYLHVNGRTSTIKISADSEVELTKMETSRVGAGASTKTILTLKIGEISGSVKKLSANSGYEIHTPNGVAAIRGTDFQISARPLPDKRVRVTFSCVAGQFLVTSTVNGVSVTKAMGSNQQWTPGDGDITTVNPQIIDYLPGHPPISLFIPPVILQQPFNNGAAPNPAVDVVHPIKRK